MSKPTLAKRLRKIADWITESGEGSVREPDPDELRDIADEVEALHENIKRWTGPKLCEAKATIAKYEEEMRDAVATLEDSKRHGPGWGASGINMVWADIDDVLTAQTILLNALNPETAGEDEG